MDRIVSILGVALGIGLIAHPAFAVALIPEPATMSVLGLGVAGAFVARKLIKRK
jgi:PEP-CTERM motif